MKKNIGKNKYFCQHRVLTIAWSVLIWKILGNFPAQFCTFNGSCVRHATFHTQQRCQ